MNELPRQAAPSMLDYQAERHPVEVLAAEFVERFRQGERPSITEYTTQHPGLAEEIRALFPTIVLMEGVKYSRSHGLVGGPVPLEKVPERLGDYRIVREVGRGGMGIVYEAEQESLGRRVAVKVLTAQPLLDAEQLRRFHREAEAMARLHHTNIVPVFGISEHGHLVYYVMQFIEGRGLDAVLRSSRPTENAQPADDEQELTPMRVAQLGLQVAEALAYAHAQGVLHRDIKPSNLLLDGQGTVWITDFGLAKMLEYDDVTQPGELAGTLRYMAPERFRGHSDARSDIYSLGLTLYELLTRRPAFDESDRGRLVRQVTQEEPPAPRTCNPAIPRDLETVVLRALARDPEQRYPSAEDLAEDLRRFLEDRPVTARRIGLLGRLGRWCRRNPALAGVTALAGSLLVLAIVSITSSFVEVRAALGREASLRQQAEHQQHNAEINLGLANAAIAREHEQRQEAIAQQQRAQANLALALTAFEEIFAQTTRGTVAPSLEVQNEDGVPIHAPVVSREGAALLDNLLKFYNQFGERNHADVRLQREIARAHRRVGDIQQRLGQLDKAEAAYRQALALYEALARISAAKADCLCEKAAARNELGFVLQLTGRYVQAEKAHRRALKVLTFQGAEGAPSARRSYELARTHTLLGGVLWKTGRTFGLEEHHRCALKLLTQVQEEDPQNPKYRLAQAREYRNLSSALGLKGRHAESLAAHGKAIVLLKELVNDYPSVSDYRYELGQALLGHSTAGPGGRRRPGQEQQLRAAVDLAKDLADSFPAVPQYQALQARAFQRLGSALYAAGKAEEAERFYLDALRLDRALVCQFPGVPFYQRCLADACRSWGMILLRRGQLGEACAHLKEAVDAQQAVVERAPGNWFGRSILARDWQALAGAFRQLGDQAESRSAFERAAQVMKRR